MTVDDICALIARHRFNYFDEDRLHEGIAETLGHGGVAYIHEHTLEGNRFDFYLAESGVAIEVKIKGSLADLTRQVYRYTRSQAVRGVVIVTDKMRLSNLSDEMNGKPVRVVTLLRAFA